MNSKSFLLTMMGLMLYTALPAQTLHCGSIPTSDVLQRNTIEQNIRQWQKNMAKTSNGVLQIPVAVHVVYRTASQDFPNALVLDYISEVNKALRKQIAPAFTPRLIFDTLWADTEVELCIATGTGNTPLITHTQTSVYFNNMTIENIKHTATGGKDPMPVSDYLNIWIAPVSGASMLMGNAVNNNVLSYPGATEGIFINSSYYSSILNTLIHEVGHFTGLLHTFDNAAEMVEDTPYEGTEGRLPLNRIGTSCLPGDLDSNTSVIEDPWWGTTDPPDMIENFMGYNRPCQFMFTKGQKERMHAMLNTYYAGMLNNNCLMTTSVATTGTAAAELVLYPVPSPGTVHIRKDGLKHDVAYYVYNTTGAVIAHGILMPEQTETLHLPTGIYYIKAAGHTKKAVVY